MKFQETRSKVSEKSHFNIMNIGSNNTFSNIDTVKYNDLIEINETITRGYNLKLKKSFCQTKECRKYSF